jgi:hypothetical protein
MGPSCQSPPWSTAVIFLVLGSVAACSSGSPQAIGDAAAGTIGSGGLGGAGSTASDGEVATAGASGAAGNATAGADGAASDAADAGGAGGAGDPTDAADAQAEAAGFTDPFACTMVAGTLLTQAWFIAGFEDAGLDGTKWEGKFQHYGYVDIWAQDPPGGFAWNAIIQSACTQNPEAPDRVIFTAWSFELSSKEDVYVTTTAAAVRQFIKHYPSMKRLDLMTIIRCPGDPVTLPGGKMCNPNADYVASYGHDLGKEDCYVPPTVDGALEKVAAQFPGLVFVAPKFYSPDCPPTNGGSFGAAGNAAVAKDIAAYYRTNP